MQKLLILSTLLFNLAYAQNFPNDWIGEYEGDMLMGNVSKTNDTVPISFQIAEVIPDSIWDIQDGISQ